MEGKQIINDVTRNYYEGQKDIRYKTCENKDMQINKKKKKERTN